MSCLEKRFAQPKKIRKIMIGTDLNIKPVTCGLPAKQSQPSAVKLVEIHVGIILSETKKTSFFLEQNMFHIMFDEVFPYIYIYGFTSWMSKRFPNQKNTKFQHHGLKPTPTRSFQNLQAAVTSLIQLLDPNVGAAKVWVGWVMGRWKLVYLPIYITWKNPQKSTIDMYR